MEAGEKQGEFEACGQYLLRVLSAVLHGQRAPSLPDGLTWEDVYSLAVFHRVESMAFYGVKAMMDSESPLFKRWEEKDARNAVQALCQQEELRSVVRRLTAAGIRVMPMKGSIIHNLYGQIHFRFMGDLDLLIDEDKAAEARKIMEEAGYWTKEYGEEHHDIYILPPYVCVELHRSMLPKDNAYSAYFEDIWERAAPDRENPNYLLPSLEDFYIFHVIHFRKHYEIAGSGIRAIMDTYQFRKVYGDRLDKKKAVRALRRLGLEAFAGFMETLSLLWFGTEREKKKAAGADISIMEHKILESGIYGLRTVEVSRRYWSMVSEHKIFPRTRYFLWRIFMNRRKMEKDYPILARYPVLLPACWVHRAAIAVLCKRDVLKKEIGLLYGEEKKKDKSGR